MSVTTDDPFSTTWNFPTIDTKQGLNVAQLLLEYLKLEGVSKIFGIPGGTIIYLMNEIKKQQKDFEFVICRHETGAAYIATGYAIVKVEDFPPNSQGMNYINGLGVVLTTSGPAAANPLTGALNAQTCGVPLLVITGEIPQQYYGMGYLQEGIDAKLDIAAIYKNAVKYSTVITNEKHSGSMIQQALRVARSLPSTATHISLPNDVAASCVTANLPASVRPHPLTSIPFPVGPGSYRTLPSGTDVAKVGNIFKALTDAQRPLIFLGNGARLALRSQERLTRFAALCQKYFIPVMTTPDAKGIFPESHWLSLRNYGLTACLWSAPYLGSKDDSKHYCDALLVIGSSLGDLATTVREQDHFARMQPPQAFFAQVDTDQSAIGRNFPVTMGIVGEAGATIDALCDVGQHAIPGPDLKGRPELIEEIKSIPAWLDPKLRDSDAAPLNAAALCRIVSDEVKDGHVFIDAGNCVGWSLHYMEVNPPLYYHSALNMGPMGFAVGAVIGGKMAAPDKDCVAIVGDGGFMMHGMEVSTAAQNRVGAVWIVLADNDLSMVSQGMDALFPKDKHWLHYYKLGNPDLAKVAEGLGARGVTITRQQGGNEFRAALKTALERARTDQQPQVIAVNIDTDAQPPYGWPLAPVIDCSKS